MKATSRSHKITKQPVDPERIRTMPAQFGAVDRRLVYQKHIRRMSGEQIVLYLFLQCVSDAEGLSFYSDERICEELHFSLNGLWKARDALIGAGFLLYRRPMYQLLNLMGHSSPHTTMRYVEIEDPELRAHYLEALDVLKAQGLLDEGLLRTDH